ncbi:MAG: PadR family transcriptional regulator [Planctomycetota bacterium]
MSLDHVLLGVLREASSGYDLKLWFDRVFRHMWAAEPSQIYRVLSRLEKEGLLSSTEEASAKGPPRRVFRTTTRGRGVLRSWLRAGPSMSDSRQAQLAQILFLSAVGRDDQVRFLEELRAEYEARLRELEAVRDGVADQASPEAATDDEEFFRRLTLDAGLHQYRSWIAWVDHARAMLDARQPNSTTKERRGGTERS